MTLTRVHLPRKHRGELDRELAGDKSAGYVYKRGKSEEREIERERERERERESVCRSLRLLVKPANDFKREFEFISRLLFAPFAEPRYWGV